MKSLKDLVVFLKGHKNTPDLHSAMVYMKSDIMIGIDYADGSYFVCVYYSENGEEKWKTKYCKDYDEIVEFAGDDDMIRFEM